MSWLVDKLRGGRIASAIEQIERGESVDWPKVAQLQALDMVRAGQLDLADAIEREDKADDDFSKLLGQ